MQEKAWCQGTKELLDHASKHLQSGESFDIRIAMISIDNAIEVAVKTYFELPERITGLKVSRKEQEEIFISFESLLAGLDKYLPGSFSRESLSDISYFHRLRNKLYHESGGFSLERGRVDTYLALGELLHKKLFHPEEEQKLETKENRDLFQMFILLWNMIEGLILDIVTTELSITNPELRDLKILVERDKIDEKTLKDIEYLREFRNRLVHGLGEISKEDLNSRFDTMNSILGRLQECIAQSQIR